MKIKFSTLILSLLVLLIGACSIKKQESNTTEPTPAKSLVDYFKPMPIQKPLVSSGTWGGEDVLPRDTANGLEDATLEKWCYWDGGIIKDDEGLYHMFASHWSQELPHSRGWKTGSKAIHAVSENVVGPYKDLGEIHPDWKEGTGHNVVALRMKDGRYAVVQSERTPGEVFVSDSPYGPYELLGEIQVDLTGHPESVARYDHNNKGAVRDKSVGFMANVGIILRPDGRYMMIPRTCVVFISEGGILGPYKVVADTVYKGMEGVPQSRMEDPTFWYSGGMYHMIANHHAGGDVSYHFSSTDGINDWKYRGIAFSKDRDVFKYEDGTSNYWQSVQRMSVYVEDGHPRYFHFSVVDSRKGEDLPNDNHGSKIIMVPFDGEAFDRDMQEMVQNEKEKE